LGSLYNGRVSIQDISEKFKNLLADDGLYMGLTLVLVGVISFGLGQQSVRSTSEDPGVPETSAVVVRSSTSSPVQAREEPSAAGRFVASQQGSAYHLPWCPGARQINDENTVWFASRKEAEAQGYAPAKNCPGL